ncbi:MAG: peptidoglycan-binding domain-containing protein [Acidimicrobiales bacterium]
MADLLKKGDRGPAVKTIQEDLTKLGYEHGKPDGIFGPRTEAVVKQAQEDNGLPADGVVGPATRGALAQQSVDERLLKSGATGAAVEQAQRLLAGAGFDIGPIDGIFGPKLVAAIKVLQEKHGLTVDGVVGPRTWRALKSL